MIFPLFSGVYIYSFHHALLFYDDECIYISPCCQGCGGSVSGGGDRSSGEQRSISTGETNSGSLSSHGELSQTNVHCPNKCSEKQVALSELIVVIDERTDRVHYL